MFPPVTPPFYPGHHIERAETTIERWNNCNELGSGMPSTRKAHMHEHIVRNKADRLCDFLSLNHKLLHRRS